MDVRAEKQAVRTRMKQVLAGVTAEQRRGASVAATSLLTSSEEFRRVDVVMIFLSMESEIDTTALALRCWQMGKTVVAPRVFWNERRMLPIEINSLSQEAIHEPRPGLREPLAGGPMPVAEIELAIIPGLAFTTDGLRIGRGMGFYDRFLAQRDFTGICCGFGMESQILETLPVEPHDVPLQMLVTDRAIRRFSHTCTTSRP